jgi:hypothetical protein
MRWGEEKANPQKKERKKKKKRHSNMRCDVLRCVHVMGRGAAIRDMEHQLDGLAAEYKHAAAERSAAAEQARALTAQLTAAQELIHTERQTAEKTVAKMQVCL